MSLTFALMLLLAFGIGVATAAQSPTNGVLGVTVGPIQAGLVSMFGGFVILSVLCFFFGTGDITQALTVPLWMWTGGLIGAYIVVSMATCVRNLGVALSLTLIMLGQLLAGMAIDVWGLLGSAVLGVSPLRVLGALFILVGIVLVYVDRLRYQGKHPVGAEEPQRDFQVALQVLLIFSAGALSAFQAPINTGLSYATGTLEASVISFAGGWLSLLVITLIVNKGRLKSFKGAKPWQFTGGVYGAFGVPSLVIATPVLGVGLVMGGTMVGQIVAGMIIDATGAFCMQKRRVNALRVVGSIVLLVGVLLVSAGTH